MIEFSDILITYGSICFTLLFIPQAIQVFKQKHAKGVNLYSIFFGLTADISMTLAVFLGAMHPVTLISHISGTICLTLILYFKLNQKERE